MLLVRYGSFIAIDTVSFRICSASIMHFILNSTNDLKKTYEFSYFEQIRYFEGFVLHSFHLISQTNQGIFDKVTLQFTKFLYRAALTRNNSITCYQNQYGLCSLRKSV